VEVKKETGRWKDWWKVWDLLVNGKCSKMVLDFLATTDVGRQVPEEEDDAISTVSELEGWEWMEKQGAVTNLVRQAPWRRRRRHSHPCHPVARPRFRCRSHGHPPRLGASTDFCHIAPVVAISPTAGRSRPLSFVSVMLLARPSPVIVTYVVSC